MSQPKHPPLTMRIQPELRGRVEAFAAARNLSISAAGVMLLEDGLASNDSGAAAPAKVSPKAVLRAAERKTGVEPVTLANTRQAAARDGAKQRDAPKLDTSMVQVGPGPRIYGAMAKGQKTTKGKR